MAFIDGNDGENFMTERLIEKWNWLEQLPEPREEEGMSCYNCKNYEPWGGLGDVNLKHYCGKDGQIGVRCNPSESEDCNGYKPRMDD